MAKFRRDAFAGKDPFGTRPFFPEKDTAPVKPSKKASKASKAEAAAPKATAKAERIELWAYDEYNQGNIIMSSSNIAQIIDKARKYVTEINCDNALASGERDKAWEAYFPIVFKGKDIDLDTLYAGNKLNGKHYVYSKVDGVWKSLPMPAGTEMKFFLGDVSNGRKSEAWFLSDVRGKTITSLTDQNLENKMSLFVKIVTKNV